MISQRSQRRLFGYAIATAVAFAAPAYAKAEDKGKPANPGGEKPEKKGKAEKAHSSKAASQNYSSRKAEEKLCGKGRCEQANPPAPRAAPAPRCLRDPDGARQSHAVADRNPADDELLADHAGRRRDIEPRSGGRSRLHASRSQGFAPGRTARGGRKQRNACGRRGAGEAGARPCPPRQDGRCQYRREINLRSS